MCCRQNRRIAIDKLIFFSQQIIQRQLEQVEEKQRQLEERGVAVEKALRGEAGIQQSLVCFLMFFYQMLVQ